MIKTKFVKNILFCIFITLILSIALCIFFEVPVYTMYLVAGICMFNMLIAAFARDICGKKEVQKQRQTYISTLSHDLKIPTLAQIRALDLLLNENVGKINKEQREILNLTLDSCNFMYGMLSTILDTYKYENKEITLNFEKTLIFKMVDDCFKKSYETLKAKNIKIRIRAKDDSAVIFADRIQIKKAFENLIAHCVSSAYENTEIICELSQAPDEKNIYISLMFESPYVSVQTLRNMLNMYNTPADKMDKVGSGLSIYLAKKIIEAHYGSVFVDSRGTNSSVYNIELPCYVNECKICAALF